MPRNPTTALLPSTTVKSRPEVDEKRLRDSTTRLRVWGGAVIGGPGTPGKPVPAGTYAKNIRGVNGYKNHGGEPAAFRYGFGEGVAVPAARALEKRNHGARRRTVLGPKVGIARKSLNARNTARPGWAFCAAARKLSNFVARAGPTPGRRTSDAQSAVLGSIEFCARRGREVISRTSEPHGADR
jgi:hypothetical protein